MPTCLRRAVSSSTWLLVLPSGRFKTATLDDEEVTRADEESMARAQADIEAGRITPHEDVLREFGLR